MAPSAISAQKNARCKSRGEARKKANIERHEGYRAANAKLSPVERLNALDKAFGKGKGAGKERARLALLIKVQENQPKAVDKKRKSK